MPYKVMFTLDLPYLTAIDTKADDAPVQAIRMINVTTSQQVHEKRT